MSQDAPALVARIEELESQLAFQEEHYQQLNDIVARQDREILELKRELKALAARMTEMGETSSDGDPASEVPPHY